MSFVKKYSAILLFFVIFLFVVGFLSTLIPLGCSINHNGYKMATVTKSEVSFSFEYPSSYQDKNHTLDSNIVTSSLLLHRVDKNSTWENPNTTFMMSITNNSSYSNAETKLDKILQQLKQSNPGNNIEILENEGVKVAGVDGYFLHYYAEYGQHPHFITYVFFDFKDRVWMINMDALETASLQAKAEFEHIINSLTFNN